MYWGGFYGYYNTMLSDESVHTDQKFFVEFLVILYIYSDLLIKIKKTASIAAFLGEGIFTMGYSKNYI